MAKGNRKDSGTEGAPGAQAPAPDQADATFPDIADLSYEQARDELIAIVARLEGGQSGLEESMLLWRRGEALAAHCSTWLDDAESALARDAED